MTIKSESKICVCGLGYVGLPLMASLSKYFDVVGFDNDVNKIQNLQAGIDPTQELTKSQVLELKNQKFEIKLEKCVSDIYIVTVPTPVTENNIPDLSILKSITKEIAMHLKEGDIVVYESTVFPGATEEICAPILEEFSGLTLSEHFHLGYSPERINPSDKVNTLKNTTKLLAATTPETSNTLARIYGRIVDEVYLCSSIKVAEAAKVLENTQRDVNIALMNEASKVFHTMDIKTSEVVDAASTKWNFHKYTPGLVGGHCIGVDPYYLTTKAQSQGVYPELILAARAVNENMAGHIANKIIRKLILSEKQVANSNILTLGTTFKPDCPDERNSKVYDLMKELSQYNINIDFYDPYTKSADNLTIDDLNAKKAYDCVILAVPHQCFLNNVQLFITKQLSPDGILVDLYNKYPGNLDHSKLMTL